MSFSIPRSGKRSAGNECSSTSNKRLTNIGRSRPVLRTQYGSRSCSLFGLELRDLVALYAEAGHQSFLAEDEGVDIVFHGRCCRILRLSFHDDDGRTDADFEAIRLIELLQRPVVHEEHRVAVGLAPACRPTEAPVVL